MNQSYDYSLYSVTIISFFVQKVNDLTKYDNVKEINLKKRRLK